MLFKLFLILIIFLNLGIPLNNKLDVITIIISISVLILLKNTKFNQIITKKKFFLTIIIITFINTNLPKFFFLRLVFNTTLFILEDSSIKLLFQLSLEVSLLSKSNIIWFTSFKKSRHT